MTFTQSISTVFRKYVKFSGRASRSEYWWFMLFYYVIFFILLCPVVALSVDFDDTASSVIFFFVILLLIFALGASLPLFALTVRRCHDAGYSGWMILVPIFNYIIPFLPSKDDNKWGAKGE